MPPTGFSAISGDHSWQTTPSCCYGTKMSNVWIITVLAVDVGDLPPYARVAWQSNELPSWVRPGFIQIACTTTQHDNQFEMNSIASTPNQASWLFPSVQLGCRAPTFWSFHYQVANRDHGKNEAGEDHETASTVPRTNWPATPTFNLEEGVS